jgi:hypothetical protein
MANRSKAKGSAAELAVQRTIIAAGVPCERVPAGATLDRGDLWVPVIEWPSIDVKNCNRLDISSWVTRAEEQAANAGRRAGVVWAKRVGRIDPLDWYVVTTGRGLLRLLEVSV